MMEEASRVAMSLLSSKKLKLRCRSSLCTTRSNLPVFFELIVVWSSAKEQASLAYMCTLSAGIERTDCCWPTWPGFLQPLFHPPYLYSSSIRKLFFMLSWTRKCRSPWNIFVPSKICSKSNSPITRVFVRMKEFVLFHLSIPFCMSHFQLLAGAVNDLTKSPFECPVTQRPVNGSYMYHSLARDIPWLQVLPFEALRTCHFWQSSGYDEDWFSSDVFCV